MKNETTRHGYTADQAAAGTKAELPPLETWANQYRGYTIKIEIPEYTSICPKTGLPDFGTITIEYVPDKRCLELKSLREYIHAFRNVGIFNENTVNRILADLVKHAAPVSAVVTGSFTARGGMRSVVTAAHRRRNGGR